MNWLLPGLKGTRVLKYHNIWPVADHFTVTPQQLEEHFIYLQENGYRSIFVSALVKAIIENKELPPKTIALTFDNGYSNQIEFVEPLLEKYGYCACLFLTGKKVMMGPVRENGTKENYLRAENLRKTDPTLFEFGLQSFSDKPFAAMNEEQIREDILMNQRVFSVMDISIIPVFAYPDSGRLYDKMKLDQIKKIMKDCGIISAFNMANGAISLPVKDIFELKRIEINGYDNLERFKIKMKKGRVSLFK
jgi:peptidoglycan/xylan/chitin deacetylase (PgdA/CDA1 family)